MNSSIPPDENPFANQPQSSQASNPFQSPPAVTNFHAPPGVDPVLFHGSGYVRQVTAVAIFMIIQGLLVGLFGVGLLFAGIAFQSIPVADAPPDFEAMRGPMSWGFNIVGVVLVLITLLLVIAGIQNLSFRGRTLGIVAISLSALTALTVYCAPTAIALAIWGLIVYLNPSVARAFELRESGVSAADIRAMVRK